jgi:hypothetical protein
VRLQPAVDGRSPDRGHSGGHRELAGSTPLGAGTRLDGGGRMTILTILFVTLSVGSTIHVLGKKLED